MIVDSSLIKNINKYIEDLQRDKHFDFSPVNVGITKHGNNLKLGFSCYALKLLFITKKWDQLNSQKQNCHLVLMEVQCSLGMIFFLILL